LHSTAAAIYQVTSTYPVPGNGAQVTLTQSWTRRACPYVPPNRRFGLTGPGRTKKARRVSRDRTFDLFKRIACPGAGGRCRVQVYTNTDAKRPKFLGRARYRVPAKTSGRRLTGRLSKSGMRRLRRADRLKLRIFIYVRRSGRAEKWRHDMVLLAPRR
jgi:hypothetical protein